MIDDDVMNDDWSDNQIGDSGGCSIGEGLKVNSTLKELDLDLRSWWVIDDDVMNDDWNGNEIRDSGGCSIGEGLKVNSTLTQLNLEMRR